MKRFLRVSLVLLLGGVLAGGSLWAAPRGGGGGGGGARMSGGGGGGGARMSGGGGARMGGGAAVRSGGGSAFRSGSGGPSQRGGISGGAALRSGGGISAGPAIRSGNIGPAVRSGGSSAAMRSGSPMPRSGSISGGSVRMPSNFSNLRATPGTSNPRGPSVNPGQSLNRSLGQSLSRPASSDGSRSVQGSTQRQLPGSVRIIAENPGRSSRNVAGRVTPSDLGDFLAISRRQGGPAVGDALRGSRGDVLRPSVNSNWRNLQTTQLNRIKDNVNVAFRRGGDFGRDWNRFDNSLGVGSRPNAHWNNWAGGVRSVGNFQRFNNCFTPRFWATNYCYFPWRSSYYWWGARPWSYWWSCPTWVGLGSWFPNYGWTTPYYYDYGPGGNVLYSSGYVYVNGQPIATAEDYAASAAALAEVPPPANPDEAKEWLPLGTFTLSEGEHDTDPSRVVQLAVDKNGHISGTMHNQKTNQTYPIQGRVDKETQRVAFTIGGNQDVVLETGIYNLTQQQTPVLAHGEGRQETYLLLRLDPPQTEEAAAPPSSESKSLVP